MAYERRKGWLATVWSGDDDRGDWAHLTITFRLGTLADAGREVTRVIGQSDESYYRQRLLDVREANGAGTAEYSQRDKYWDANYCGGVLSIRWQANLEGWDSLSQENRKASEWYAPKASLERLEDTKAAHLLVKLSKLDRGATPAAVLNAARAITVRSIQDVMAGYVEATVDLASPVDLRPVQG